MSYYFQAGFNDGDEGGGASLVATNDGYAYLMTVPQPWWQAPLWDISDVAGDTDAKNKFLSLCK